ncbi:hypothetical protein [Streptomyces sp. NBC_00691]|uniref:hypothetical protein n=1 Tax=Streptomyces sp. NBC_00691 TaxID=2903671 RepID=UPI002E2F6FF5|nr:hypothetical protein [Streptomyces sp. NBC_00691]
MAATAPSKALLRSGIGVAAAGVLALLVVAFVDLGTADQIASVTGVVLALAGLGLSLWAQFGRGGAAPVEASGTRSVAAGGSIGVVVTGDGTRTPAAPPAAPPAGGTTPTGPVTASGERSVAAGGDIGSVSTGDA